MKEEIAAAVFFLARLVKRYGCLDTEGRERFAAALTSALFESYKSHWHPTAPSRGQAYRCLRVNRVQLVDPVLQQACERSAVRYEDLGLPLEITVWVDPGEVSCRYGERSAPFCVSAADSCHRDGEFSRRVHEAVERAGLDVRNSSSSDEEGRSPERSSADPCSMPALPTKVIPTVSNPNSVYWLSEFSSGAPHTWLREKRRGFAGEAPPPVGGAPPRFSNQKGSKPERATFTFFGPRVDKYHWVSKSRS